MGDVAWDELWEQTPEELKARWNCSLWGQTQNCHERRTWCWQQYFHMTLRCCCCFSCFLINWYIERKKKRKLYKWTKLSCHCKGNLGNTCPKIASLTKGWDRMYQNYLRICVKFGKYLWPLLFQENNRHSWNNIFEVLFWCN